MAKTRLVVINGNAGTFTPIFATQVTRYVEIIEDFSVTAQGMQYQFNDGQTPAYTTVYDIGPPAEPLKLGTPVAFGTGYSLVQGTPPDNSGGYSIPATLLCNLKSATATGTTVRITEFD